MATKENLLAAFAGESQANRKYLAFAQKAQADGFPNVAKLFRAAAAAETIHAHAHLRALGAIQDTASNLQTAMDGEHYEFSQMYPGFIEESQKEGVGKATVAFKYAMDAEKGHFELYGQALDKVKGGQDLEAMRLMVCEVCGYTTTGEAPDLCPVCKAKKERFFEVE